MPPASLLTIHDHPGHPDRPDHQPARSAPAVLSRRKLRIGIVAPPWVPVPPPAYGGIEAAIDSQARGLAGRGHEVRLFTVGTSTCPVDRSSLYDEPAEAIGMQLPGLTHAFAAYEHLANCDIIHDHSLAGASLAAAGWSRIPVVTTIHGPFSPGLADLYRWIAPRIPLVAISADQASRAPTGVRIARVIHHGIDLDTYQARTNPTSSSGYLLCLARMHPTKGIDIAIQAARQARRRLVIAAKMREPAEHAYYRDVVEPLLDASITYVGEADTATKHDLLQQADALLNPIQWPEPFGMVMIEALASGTPVIATPNGAAPEIIAPGHNGWLATTPQQLVNAIGHIDHINRRQCRRDAATRFSLQTMAREHETLYRSVLATRQSRNRSRDRQRTISPVTRDGPRLPGGRRHWWSMSWMRAPQPLVGGSVRRAGDGWWGRCWGERSGSNKGCQGAGIVAGCGGAGRGGRCLEFGLRR